MVIWDTVYLPVPGIENRSFVFLDECVSHLVTIACTNVFQYRYKQMSPVSFVASWKPHLGNVIEYVAQSVSWRCLCFGGHCEHHHKNMEVVSLALQLRYWSLWSLAESTRLYRCQRYFTFMCLLCYLQPEVQEGTISTWGGKPATGCLLVKCSRHILNHFLP